MCARLMLATATLLAGAATSLAAKPANVMFILVLRGPRARQPTPQYIRLLFSRHYTTLAKRECGDVLCGCG